ncbi:MAG: SLC13 family permease [Anaerolineae bacterium]|jgi:di/tricarboxylate transporter|nr:SLC13 family permease [Anaerolineae bacterium]MBT7326438.1 SLC13 family permease [Anaerolineae bacterium]
MTLDNYLIFSILGVALILFVSEKIRVDIVAMMVLVTLTLTGLLSLDEAFSGFASPAVITVWAIFIISGGLTRSGVADLIARFILKLAGHNQVRLLVLIMLTVGLMSAFMNNIGAVAILLPAVISVAREMKTSPSKLLIPLAWASLMGGNITLVGTPPNILASSMLQNYENIPNLNFFDFAPMGIIVLITGILYMVFIGRHLLPDRTPTTGLSQDNPVREYLSEVEIQRKSPLIGKSIYDIDWNDLTVLQIKTVEKEILNPQSDHRLKSGDRLLVESPAEALVEALQNLGLAPAPEGDTASKQIPDHSLKLAEIILAPNSTLSGKTLAETNFRIQYGLSVMAIRHNGDTLFSHLAEVPLQFGDSLLVQGSFEKLTLLRNNPDFLTLDTHPPLETRRTHKAPLTVAILLGALIFISTGWLSIPIALLIGAISMVLSGTISMDEAYQSIEWKSVFLIAGMLPLGIAMENTGTAQLIADWIVNFIGGWGALAVLIGIYLMTSLLTEIISNAAATVLVIPIAIDTALRLGADPRAFIIGVVLAASTSFLMPIGHQVNVIVFGPGDYKFLDYTRVGILLNIILLIVVMLTLPVIWPLYP